MGTTQSLLTVIFIVGTVLLITSLGRHTKKVFFSISGFHSSSAQAHIKALLAFISFAIFFTSSFLSLVLTASGMFPFGEFRFWIWQTVIYLGTAIHPIILLLSNHRLRAVLGRGCSSAHGASWIAIDEKPQILLQEAFLDGMGCCFFKFLCHV